MATAPPCHYRDFCDLTLSPAGAYLEILLISCSPTARPPMRLLSEARTCSGCVSVVAGEKPASLARCCTSSRSPQCCALNAISRTLPSSLNLPRAYGRCARTSGTDEVFLCPGLEHNQIRDIPRACSSHRCIQAFGVLGCRSPSTFLFCLRRGQAAGVTKIQSPRWVTLITARRSGTCEGTRWTKPVDAPRVRPTLNDRSFPAPAAPFYLSLLTRSFSRHS